MIYNPKKALENGFLIAPEQVDLEKNIQQNGVDVDCDKVFLIQSEPLIISEDFKSGTGSIEILPEKVYGLDESKEWFFLKAGRAYTFDSSFNVNVPSFLGAKLIGRSTFNRNGILIRSSWYDSGFKGNAGATIYCFRDLIIEKGTRIAQIIFEEADSSSMYNGQYQSK